MENTKTGTVNWFNPTKGYGFLKKDEDGTDLFFHTTARVDQMWNPVEGEKVEFTEGMGQKGPNAENVKQLGAADNAEGAEMEEDY